MKQIIQKLKTQIKIANFLESEDIILTTSEGRKIVDVLEKSQWISVDDRLPENENYVLAVLDGQTCIMSYFDFQENGETFKVWGYVYDGINGDGEYDDNYNPTHWQPLPTFTKSDEPLSQ